MTRGDYYVGLDVNRDRYFPHGVGEGDALNLVDNPAQLKTSRIGATNNPPAFARDFYSIDQNYYWEFTTGTAVDAGCYIGQADDFEQATWIPTGIEITVAMEFKGITNYTGETLRFTAAGRGGGAGANTANTTLVLTGDWQQVSVTITPATAHLLLTIERITTLTDVTYQMRKHFVAIGSSLPAAYNTGDASDYYESISDTVMGMSWNNGMDHYDQSVSGGSHATLTLDNRDGHFYQNDDTAANILLNNEFVNWVDANNPTSWGGTNISANAQTTEVGSDELHGGTGQDALNLYATSRVLVECWQDGLTAFQRYRVRFSIGASSSVGGVRFFTGNSTFIYPVSRLYTIPGVYTFYFTAAAFGRFVITNNRYPCDVTLEFVEVVPVPRYAGLGKEVIVSIRGTAAATEYQMFTGRVASITPDGGQLAVRTVTMECVDAMAEFNTLEYRPTEIYEGVSPIAELILMFPQISLLWPYAKDYWFLDTSVLGVDTWLSDGAALSTVTGGVSELSIDFANASASNSSKGIAAQAFVRDIMALEIGGRFYIDARTGVFTAVSHTYDPSVSSSTALTDDDFDGFELPYADDVLNTITIWYKQKRLGEGNIVLWSSNQDITVGAKSNKTITGRYFDPTNELINVSAVSTEPIVRGTDFIITPSTQYDYRVTVTADVGSASVTFTIENIRQVEVTISTLQIRGFPLYALTEESITVQNSSSLIDNNIQKRDYNMPLISDSDTAIAIATGLTTMRGAAIERLQTIMFYATKSDTRYSRALSQTIGLHYVITSSVLKHSAEYVLIGEKHSVAAGGDNTHMVTWVLAPVELFNYWILGQAGRSELGTTTVPIY